MELKGFDGDATLTDSHLVFTFKKRFHSMKGMPSNEILLAEVVAAQLTPPSMKSREMLRVRTTTSTPKSLELYDPFTLMLGGRSSGGPFLAELLSRSSAARETELGDVVADAPRTEAQEQHAQSLRTNPTASFAGYELAGGQLRKDLDVWDVRNSKTSVDVGQPRKSVTATRVVLLGVFSLAMKKDRTKIYVTIETPTETLVVEGLARDEHAARVFASAVERSV
jgi:hypothetical protein